MLNKYGFYLVFCVLLIGSNACNKEGTGGKATITGMVTQDGMPIPSSVVMIKYGAKEFPGFDEALYDDRVTTGSDAAYAFTNLYKGDYYLYATGYDAILFENVSGGIGVNLKKKRETVEIDVPVTK